MRLHVIGLKKREERASTGDRPCIQGPKTVYTVSAYHKRRNRWRPLKAKRRSRRHLNHPEVPQQERRSSLKQRPNPNRKRLWQRKQRPRRPLKRLSTKPAANAEATVPPAPADEKSKRPKKEKVVRDSFTMPKSDYVKIASLKQKCLDSGVRVKKSELLRAALAMLDAVPAKQLLDAINATRSSENGTAVQRLRTLREPGRSGVSLPHRPGRRASGLRAGVTGGLCRHAVTRLTSKMVYGFAGPGRTLRARRHQKNKSSPSCNTRPTPRR